MSRDITIDANPESDLARALKESDGAPITVVSEGERYQLTRATESEWDADAVRAHFARYAGFLSEAEAEEIKERIYLARESGSQPNFSK